MMSVHRSLAIAALCLGALVMLVPQADAGKNNRYGAHGGAKYSRSGLSGGVRGYNRGYRRHTNNRAYSRGYSRHLHKHGYARRGCYGAYCRSPYGYANRGYYPKPFYGPSVYQRYYGLQPYYRPYPRIRTSYSRSHYNYCVRRYRSYRASDNSFQPYHGPRKACRSPH